MHKIFDLSIGTELDSGCENLVFQHPNNPDLLIKVIIPLWLKKRNYPDLKVTKPAPKKIYEKWKWEIKAVSQATMRAGQVHDFLQANEGFCDTSLGLGLIVVKVSDGKGNLAPTILDATLNGWYSVERILEMIDKVLDQIAQAGVTTWDISARNFLISGKPGAEHLTMIDGIGDRAFIPLRSHSRWLAKQSQKRKRAELHRWIIDNYQATSQTRLL